MIVEVSSAAKHQRCWWSRVSVMEGGQRYAVGMGGEITDEDAGHATIRMFPDYADTVLWFGDGPVEYSDTGLTAALIDALQRWEQTFYESRNDDLKFVSRAAEASHAEEGVQLAERVSAEVGPRFAIACDSVDDRTETLLLRAERPAENPAAEAAFTRLREELIAEEKRTADIVADSSGVWMAYAPLTGETFTPNQRSGRSQDQG
jgi:hypothetical protein